MLRTTLALLTLSFAHTAFGADPLPPADLTDVVRKLEAAVTDLKEANRIALERRLNTDVDIRVLTERIAKLETQVRDLKPTVPPAVTSERMDMNGKSAKLRMVNEYFTEFTVYVNGKRYTLLPGEDFTVDMPAGSYTYQVMNLQPTPQNRRAEPGETKVLRLYPER